MSEKSGKSRVGTLSETRPWEIRRRPILAGGDLLPPAAPCLFCRDIWRTKDRPEAGPYEVYRQPCNNEYPLRGSSSCLLRRPACFVATFGERRTVRRPVPTSFIGNRATTNNPCRDRAPAAGYCGRLIASPTEKMSLCRDRRSIFDSRRSETSPILPISWANTVCTYGLMIS